MIRSNNIKVTYLTPEELELIDPTECARNMFRSLPRHCDMVGHPSPYYKREVEWYLTRYYETILKNIRVVEKHRPYLQFVDEMTSKVVQQGGMITLDHMTDILSEYYELGNTRIKNNAWLVVARDYWIERFKRHLSLNGVPQDFPLRYGNTFSGLPGCEHKSDYRPRSMYDAEHFMHIFMNMPWFRHQAKWRTIFMDALSNYAYYMPSLQKCKEWMKREFPLEFDAWRNPNITMKRRFTECVDRGDISIEGDFKGADIHFSWDLTQNIILPLYEVLLEPGEFLRFACATEEYFHQELFLGDCKWSGIHTLFSGIPPTNDFETVFDVVLQTAVLLKNGLMGEAELFQNGDDITIALRSKWGIRMAERLASDLREIAADAGMEIHPFEGENSKSRISTDSFRFLKTVYYHGGKRTPDGVLVGAYPTNLVLRNILMPEKVQLKAGLAACADLQRLDGATGSPDWSQVVDLLGSNTKHAFANITEEDVLAFNSAGDWWAKLYGEYWTPEVSPSYLHLLQTKSPSFRVK